MMLREYSDIVVLEVGGHDHYADFRFHSSKGVINLPDPTTKFNFHNIFVAPGMTPYGNSNPGVSKFEISAEHKP